MKNIQSFLVFLFLCIASISNIFASPDTPCPFIESVNVITGQYSEFHTDLNMGGPRPLTLQRAYYGSPDGDSEQPLGWRFNHHGLLNPCEDALVDAAAHDSTLVYELDQEGRPLHVAIQNPAGTKTFNWMKLLYVEGEKKECHIDSSDGRSLAYIYSNDPLTTRGSPSILLEKIIDANGVETLYSYKQHPTKRKMLVDRREGADGRFIEVDYYNGQHNYVAGEIISLSDPMNDPRIGNVKCLKAPVGYNNEPVVTHSFIYNKDHTIVFDADRNMTIYRFNSDACLTAIETYLIEEGKSTTLYRKELLYWSTPTDDLPPKFIGRAIADANGTIKAYTQYRHDNEGNLIEETVYGNLTGESTAPIILNSKGITSANGVESASTTYEYKVLKEGGSPVMSKKTAPNGMCTRYEYDAATERQTALFLCDGDTIRIRQFYLYDEDGLLVTTISDDGNSPSIDDISGVTQRHIVRITLRDTEPATGMPEIIDEYFVENGGAEILQKKTVNTYSSTGRLVRQECHDAAGSPIAAIERDYDDKGRCIRTVEANGSSQSHRYDANGNIEQTTETDTAGRSRTIHNQYDFSNRLIHTEETTETGSTISSGFRYNSLCQKIASVDSYGNETEYDYDALGRLTRLTHPEVRIDDDTWIHPTVINSYDILGNITSTIDPSGYRTVSTYNARGMPVEVLHADGTREKYVYYRDGSLHKHYARNGFLTVTTHDFLGRPTQTEQYSADGTPFNTTTAEYSAFHLLRTSDSTGVEMVYEYNSEGKQSAVTRNTAGGSSRTEFLYDAQGRLKGQKEWFGPDENEFTVTTTERDAQGNVIETRVEDANGTLLRCKKADTANAPQAKALARDLVAHNPRNQLTPQEVTTDDKGNTIVTTLDALGRIEKLSKTDCMGKLIEEKELLYDASGNKIREIHTIQNNEAASSYTIAWKYGPCNRLEQMIEGIGSPDQRTTLYGYDKYGVLNKITKPDGVTNTFIFDGAGRLKQMSSSDKSCNYEHSYDTAGNIVSTYDHIYGTTTSRQYDGNGNIIEEQLGNGLTIRKQFDVKGRPTELILPDNSSIAYRYDALDLKEISRLSSSSQVLYNHLYDAYDLEGKPHLLHLAADAGTISYNFDSKGRFTNIASPFWQQSISYNTHNATRVDTKDPSGNFSVALAYDSGGQVIKESSDEDTLYSYDTIANRTSRNNDAYTLGHCNELLNDGTNSFRYDANGNMIEMSNADMRRTFRYDALNRLINVAEEGAWSLSFTYDAFNRRLTKTFNDSTTTSSERYFYDGDKEIGCCDDNGTITALRVLGIGLAADIGAAVAIEVNDALYIPIHNHRGAVCCLVDAGTLLPAEFSRFTVFGEEVLYDNNGKIKPSADAINPWRFSSKRADAETGLLFFGQRYYAPEQGRWITLDPLGHPDGPNRYAFSKNNPVAHLDLFGLYSWSNFLDDFVSTITSCYNAVATITSKIFGALRSEAEYLTKMRPSLTSIFEKYFGTGFLTLSGFYSHPMETGNHGQGEISDNVRITFINGILNIRSSFRETLELMSQVHGGTNIHYIFRPTDGWCWDMLKSMLVKFGYVSPYARELAATWKKLIQEMGGVENGGMIIHYCHSLGGADTVNAASLLTPEEKMMIHVISLGSATQIHGDVGFYTATNYVSVRDAIPYSDPIGYLQGIFSPNSNTIFIGSFFDGMPLIDHQMNSNTYIGVLTTLGYKFLEMYTVAY